jgi:hypothetical protein
VHHEAGHARAEAATMGGWFLIIKPHMRFGAETFYVNPPRSAKHYRYSPAMFRLCAIAALPMAIVFASLNAASIANASPASEHGECSFTLGPAKVTTVSGVQFVTAAVTSGKCTGDASPADSQVCLAVQGDGSAGHCAAGIGSSPAVLYDTYRAGESYVMTGQGCFNVFGAPYRVCEDYGPSRITP